MKTANIVAAAVLLLVLAGCNDTSGPGRLDLTLENAWPSTDGDWWRFAAESVVEPYDGSLDWSSGVPYDVLYAALEDRYGRPIPFPDDAVAYPVTLRFDGDMVTQSGAEGQRLVAVAGDGKSTEGLGLLRALARARPDLRAGIEARLAARGLDKAALDEDGEHVPILINGGCWARTEDAIIGYGDIDRDPGWLYLQEPLATGRTVTFQLVPALADDVFLHMKILGRKPTRVDGVAYYGATEVFYVIDMGEQMAVDEEGNELGTSRSYAYGTIVYVPSVGPVRVIQHDVMSGHPMFGDPRERSRRRTDLILTSYGSLEPETE